MSPEPEIIRNFTNARKIPKLFGRFRDGTMLFGGPYTLPQLATAFVVFLGVFLTRGLWGAGNLFSDLLISVLATAIAVYLAARIPVTNRSAFSYIDGFVTAISAPRMGKRSQRPVRLTPAHQGPRPRPSDVEDVRRRLQLATATGAAASAPAAPRIELPTQQSASRIPIGAPALPASTASTGVARLLEIASQTKETS